jgi:hypothetical protein
MSFLAAAPRYKKSIALSRRDGLAEAVDAIESGIRALAPQRARRASGLAWSWA